jgi:hypothetical protein
VGKFLAGVLACAVWAAAVTVGAANAGAADDYVHGRMWTKSGQRILHVWGTNYQMGFAHGYFLGRDIMDLMAVYTFPPPGDGPVIYDIARLFVQTTFDATDAEFFDEARGMQDGMIAGGVDPYVDVLGRDFDYWDIITLNSLSEILAWLCTTLGAWDDATAAEPRAPRQTIVAHNTDFRDEYLEAPMLMAQKSVVISYSPSDPQRQRFIAVSNAGVLGAPFLVNEAGVVATINAGTAFGHTTDPILDPKPQHAGWTTRQAISLRGVNGEGAYTIADYFQYFKNVAQYSTTINQAFQPRALGNPPAAALELNNKSRAMRYPADDPNFAPDMFLALNWEDKLAPARDRWEQFRYELSVWTVDDVFQRQMTLANLWTFLGVQKEGLQADASIKTIQSILFLPEQMKLGVAFSDETALAPDKEPVWYDVEELFWPDPEPGRGESAITDDDNDDNDDSGGRGVESFAGEQRGCGI